MCLSSTSTCRRAEAPNPLQGQSSIRCRNHGIATGSRCGHFPERRIDCSPLNEQPDESESEPVLRFAILVDGSASTGAGDAFDSPQGKALCSVPGVRADGVDHVQGCVGPLSALSHVNPGERLDRT